MQTRQLSRKMPIVRLPTIQGGYGPGEGVQSWKSTVPLPPPVNRFTDACLNITFPQLLLRTVISHSNLEGLLEVNYRGWKSAEQWDEEPLILQQQGLVQVVCDGSVHWRSNCYVADKLWHGNKISGQQPRIGVNTGQPRGHIRSREVKKFPFPSIIPERVIPIENLVEELLLVDGKIWRCNISITSDAVS